MSYNNINLSVLAYANNFTLWHYTTTDVAVTGASYFNSASDMLCVNDLIITNVDTGGEPKTIFYIVTGNQNGAVTIAAFTA